jgi:hypothetical protein
MLGGAEYRKKKVWLSGQGFQTGAMVYVDGEGLSANFDGTTLTTLKRKQKLGVHEVYVINPDGARSNTVFFEVQ